MTSTPTINTDGPTGSDPAEQAVIRHDDIAVGDWLPGRFLSDAHGPVTAIEPYRCSPQCSGCRGAGCPERVGWRYIVLRDATEITITPGGLWPLTTARPAPGRADRGQPAAAPGGVGC